MLGIYTNWSLVDNPNHGSRYLTSLFNDLHQNNHVANLQAQPVVYNNCSAQGHRARDCPQPKTPTCKRCIENDDHKRARGHIASECPHYERARLARRYRECNETGHMRAQCPKVTCSRCKSQGHLATDCPTPIICSKCRQPGHSQKDCSATINRRFFAQMRPIPEGPSYLQDEPIEQYNQDNVRKDEEHVEDMVEDDNW